MEDSDKYIVTQNLKSAIDRISDANDKKILDLLLLKYKLDGVSITHLKCQYCGETVSIDHIASKNKKSEIMCQTCDTYYKKSGELFRQLSQDIPTPMTDRYNKFIEKWKDHDSCRKCVFAEKVEHFCPGMGRYFIWGCTLEKMDESIMCTKRKTFDIVDKSKKMKDDEQDKNRQIVNSVLTRDVVNYAIFLDNSKRKINKYIKQPKD